LIFDRWGEFQAAMSGREWAAGTPLEHASLGAPSPRPSQVFAIGLNFAEHADETGFDRPTELPPVFTKFPTCITGPVTEVVLPPGGHTDWEVEIVAVIGRPARRIAHADAWQYVAGLTVGQDLSERITQMRGSVPQFSLGKSFPGFGPTGPWLVTIDEFADPDDLELSCAINGEVVQHARSRQLLYTIPQLVAELSQVVTLQPGDLVFTGTPSGVGMGRSPQRWLQSGDELVTAVEGIGELRQRFVAG
jgi:2-keto-4-pentenoate hydratase/2-oxohepta-3-ene-1,7-dioic acid hydratase in catechol pathway